MNDATYQRMRAVLDAGEMITLQHDDPKYGGTQQLYMAHSRGGYRIIRVTPGPDGADIATIHAGPRELRGSLSGDLRDGWHELSEDRQDQES